MDEVENPDLPAAGESSPTLRPIDQDDGEDAGFEKSGIDTAKVEGLVDSANPSPLAQPALPSPRAAPPQRPGLTREGSVPPPQQPPPAPPVENGSGSDSQSGGDGSGSGTAGFEFPQEAPDSLTLADLKRIRSSFPNATQPPPKQALLSTEKVYDFDYTDAQSLPVELEEWFTYSEEEEVKLRRCKAVFNQAWRDEHEGTDWLEAGQDVRAKWVEGQLRSLRQDGLVTKTEALMSLVYVSLGVWEETAGRPLEGGEALDDLFVDAKVPGMRLDEYGRCGTQIQSIVEMVSTLHAYGGLKLVYDCLRSACEESFANSPGEALPPRNENPPKRGEESMELWCCLTLMYLFIEVARTTKGESGKVLKQDILALDPKLTNYFTQTVGRLRWDDVAPVPLTKMLLLCWKTILVTFGGIADVEALKKELRTPEEQEEKDKRTGQPIITASPLDYHLFRQELNSKYPAYRPPENVFALEPENNSILPPLKHRQSQSSFSSDFPGAMGGTGSHSIMHQPIHIATPAPSPPPSPAGPGKAGKKQNYQTNNLFPFLYPPLDGESGALGGKGSTALQDALVGKRWEGSDVPVSVVEAAELFSKRLKATRAMRQMWEVREGFCVWERGWKTSDDDDDLDVDEDFELVPKPKDAEAETAGQGEPEKERSEAEKKLGLVSPYYEDSLQHLQSVVIVLLKAVLQNLTDMVTKHSGQNGGLQAGIQFADANGMTNGSAKPAENGVNGDSIEVAGDDLDHFRSQEIQAKALTGMLLLLLKWFKASHILQYEYLTQLLLDSNYVPLVLKVWSAQDIGRAVHYKLEGEGEERGFWWFCQSNSRAGPPPSPKRERLRADGVESGVNGTMFEESEDEAAPPPIKRERQARESDEALSPTSHLRDDSADEESRASQPPEVDELGYPQMDMPTTPIKSYSWRNLFASINYLRILQKLTRRKTHRALLLVSYKSTQFLKKSLKVPVHPLRYYTLKLFKTQVPFCGRKWRQGQMKIITAVWLTIPAELRDDWLSGGGGGMGGTGAIGDVDGTVEDALPLEQGVRELVHWWNVRNYPEAMGLEGGLRMLEEEQGFFERELERMGVEKGEEEGVMEEMVQGGEEGWRGPIEGY